METAAPRPPPGIPGQERGQQSVLVLNNRNYIYRYILFCSLNDDQPMDECDGQQQAARYEGQEPRPCVALVLLAEAHDAVLA